MATFLLGQPKDVQDRAQSILQNNKLMGELESRLDLSAEVKLEQREPREGLGRPSLHDYRSYVAAFFN
eukprot:14768797-Alexandrium_andersonii.AAC.1